MSVQALALVLKQDIHPSSLKFVFAAMADVANEKEEMRCWPSVKHICDFTSLDRKTVLASIEKLIQQGWLIETDERKGRTKQIKVYRFNIDKFNTTKIGTVPNNETVPKTVQYNSSEIGTVKESRFSQERVPKTGHGTLTERLQDSPLPPKGGFREFKREKQNGEMIAGGPDWQRRVERFFETDFWISQWGPTPLEDGCQAPPEIIEKSYGDWK